MKKYFITNTPSYPPPSEGLGEGINKQKQIL